MFNCHKLIVNGKLFGIFDTQERAEFILGLLNESNLVYNSEIIPYFIDNIGF